MKREIPYSKLLEGIISGIPDIIKVYNPDYTVEFYNDVGYKFYNKTPEEIKGKICYIAHGKNQKCIECPFEKAMKTKEMVVTEKYIPELNKYLDICCNPVLDESGEVVFIVERLTDITDKKILDNLLRESEEAYRQIINTSPEAMIITEDNKIVLANNEACNLFRAPHDELKGKSIFRFIPRNLIKAIHKRMRVIYSEKRKNYTYEVTLNSSYRRFMNFQISSSFIEFRGKPAVLSLIRNITDIKKGLNDAAKIQRKTLQKEFPIPEKVDMEISYAPCKTISGDFFNFYNVNEDLVIGILIDVSGKGITAALSISAFNVLFNQEVLVNHNPIDIVVNLNKKIEGYLGESYVAVCCFSMDFKENELKVVGAGINEFLFRKGNSSYMETVTVEGPFLGMFEDSMFREKTVHFDRGDVFYFLTDGLDFILDEDNTVQNYMKKASIVDFRKYLDKYLNGIIIEQGSLKDDCTLLSLEIK